MRNGVKKEMNPATKLLIGIIIILAIILAYIFLIFKPTGDRMDEIDSQIESNNQEIAEMEAKLNVLTEKYEEVLRGEELGSEVMPYDNVKSELIFLSNVMDFTDKYNVTFSEPYCAQDNYVRREARLTFNADTYDIAREVIDEIVDCPYRTLVVDYDITDVRDNREITEGFNGEDPVKVDLRMIFLESCTEEDMKEVIDRRPIVITEE